MEPRRPTKGGQSRGSHREVRVYVDGVLERRSILLGRLGATVDSFPVIAAVGRSFVGGPRKWDRFGRCPNKLNL